MKVYQNRTTGKKITEDSYDDLYSWEKSDYRCIGSTSGNKAQDDMLLSGIIGYVTGSGIVGGLLGGSLLGGIFGDALSDNDDSPIW